MCQSKNPLQGKSKIFSTMSLTINTAVAGNSKRAKKKLQFPKKNKFRPKNTCGSRQHLLYILLGFGGSCSVFFPAPRS